MIAKETTIHHSPNDVDLSNIGNFTALNIEQIHIV